MALAGAGGAAGASAGEQALGGENGEGGAGGAGTTCLLESAGGAGEDCTAVELVMKAPDGQALCLGCGYDWFTRLTCEGESHLVPPLGCELGSSSHPEVSLNLCERPNTVRFRVCAPLMASDGPSAVCEPSGPEHCKEIDFDAAGSKLVVTLDE